MSRLLEFKSHLKDVRQLNLFPEDDFTFNYQNWTFTFYRPHLNLIRKECSDIIRIYNRSKRILFRGSDLPSESRKEISPNIYKAIPRKNRRPKDTSQEYQDDIDKIFFDKFGWRPRSEGIFATSSPSIATLYGDLHAFFPANGYKYLWSDVYSDLYSDLFENLQDSSGEYDPFEQGGKWIDDESGETFLHIWDIKEHRDYVRTKWADDIHIEGIFQSKDASNHYEGEYTRTFTWKPNETYEEWEYRMSHILENAVDTYTDKNIQRILIGSDKEIMFKCSHYYLIKLNAPHSNNYRNLKAEDFGF